MKKLLISCVLMTGAAFGQSVRYDSVVTTTASNVPAGASAAVMTLPSATVTVCAYPASGSPCTNTVPIYSDIAQTQPINNPLVTDTKGRFGFWVAPGVYTYTVQSSAGIVIGTYNISLNTVGLNAAPVGGQTVAQPAGTTLGVNSLNGVMNAALFSGSDIGAQVSAAIAALPVMGGVHCGRVVIPAGTYTQTTTITKPRCVSIIGASADATILNWTPTTGIAIQIADSGSPTGYPEGEIADLALSGPGAGVVGPIAIYLGDTYPVLVRYGDHQNLNRLRILNWDTGVTWGSNAWSTVINESLITNNNIGLSYPSTLVNANSGESISVVGSRLQNSNQAINLPGFGDFYFINDSCDFNVTCGTVNIAHFFGVHFEGNGGRMLTIKGVSESIVEIYGGFVAYDSPTGTDPDVFFIDPAADPNSLFKLSGITTILSHTVTNFVSWNISGPNAQLTIEDLPNFNGATNITNATCNFARCRIPGTWNSNTFQTALGAGIGTKLGFGMVYGNSTGLRLDATGASTTPCFLKTSTATLDCTGNAVLATSFAAGPGTPTPITNTANVPVTAATAPTGTCAPNGYIAVVVNGVTLHLATCP